MQKVAMVSLGCPRNRVDSETAAGYLEKNGFSLTSNEAEADVIIVNTCSFINSAKEESVETILELSKYKETGRCKRLVVTGCLPQRYKDELSELLPEADIFLGTNEYDSLPEILNTKEKGLFLKNFTFLQESHTPRILSQSPYTAYLKIAEGCLHNCSYCVIPSIRGKLRSREIIDIVKEAEMLADKGVVELILVAQDLSDYGKDLNDGTGLVKLLKSLVKIKYLKWIRLLYVYPDGISDSLVKLIKEEEKICKYIDIPVQHINNRILKLMRRTGNAGSIRKKLELMRTHIPEISIRTSVITGFPSETEGEFQELLTFVKEFKFENLGVFSYSQEEGTPAADMDSQIPEKVKESRKKIVMIEQKKIAKEINKKKVGEVFDVLIEGLSSETDLLISGRSYFQAPDIDGIIYINEGSTAAGKIEKVKITKEMGYDLIGKICC